MYKRMSFTGEGGQQKALTLFHVKLAAEIFGEGKKFW
jgi:hypothetical protein